MYGTKMCFVTGREVKNVLDVGMHLDNYNGIGGKERKKIRMKRLIRQPVTNKKNSEVCIKRVLAIFIFRPFLVSVLFSSIGLLLFQVACIYRSTVGSVTSSRLSQSLGLSSVLLFWL